MPKTKPKKKVTAFSLDIKLVEFIEKEAKKPEVISKSVLVNDALVKFFKLGTK